MIDMHEYATQNPHRRFVPKDLVSAWLKGCHPFMDLFLRIMKVDSSVTNFMKFDLKQIPFIAPVTSLPLLARVLIFIDNRVSLANLTSG